MSRRNDGRTCTATARSTGNRCGQSPIPGGLVCRYHGGAAPQVQAAGARRILEAFVEPALEELGRILEHKDTPPHVRLAAVRDILDRCGFKPVTQIETLPSEAQVESWIAEMEGQMGEDEVARIGGQRGG